MCIFCHTELHAMFTNEELYKKYNSVDTLRREFHHRLIQRVINEWFEDKQKTLYVDEPIPASVAQRESVRLVSGGLRVQIPSEALGV